MIELRGDLWTLPALARCITTNGDVNSRGLAVMGRGCAKQAAEFDPALPAHFGRLLKANGNHVQVLRSRVGRPPLLSFPVKHHWMEQADLGLITRSAYELREAADDLSIEHDEHGVVLVPRPGCGNGRLSWQDVRPALEDILDDRFAAVHHA